MGRPRKAVETNKKHLTKAEKEARSRAEAIHKVGREELTAFDRIEGLTPEAAAEYRRIVESASWLDDLDRNDLITYAQCWDRARRISTSPDANREILGVTRGDGSKKLIVNPLLTAWRHYTADMRAISLKLGLSSIDRLKLAAPPSEAEHENKWLKHLRRE